MKKIFIIIMLVIMCGCSNNNKTTMYQYHYENLTTQKQKIYNQIYTAFLNQKDSIILFGITKDELEMIVDDVYNDHPEIFWCENKYYYTELFLETILKVDFSYTYNKKEINKINETIEKKVNPLIDSIKELDPHSKLKHIYNYVIESSEYVLNSKDNQNITSVLLYGESVCAGYAKTIQYLLLKSGIDCSYIDGKTINENKETILHAWNMIHINNDYYYMDATWGDVVKALNHSCEAYFLMNSEEMLSLYEPHSNFESTINEEYTYYKNEHMYFDKWDENKIISLWHKANYSNKKYIEIKCSESAYEDIVSTLKKPGYLYNLLKKAQLYPSTIYYIERPELNMIDIYY